MTVVHVYGAYVAARTEGISANAHGLVAALRLAGVDAELDAVHADLSRLNRRRAILLGAWRAGKAARMASRRAGTELVHLHVSLPGAAAAARLARRRKGPPVLVHAWNAHAQPGRAPRSVPAQDRLAHRVFNGPEAAALGLSGVEDVVVASRHQARQLHAIGFRGRVHRVPNGVDTAAFRPASAQQAEAARARYGLDGDPVLLYYGHTSSWKGLAVLVDALPAVLRETPRAQVLLSLTSYGHGAWVQDAVRRAGIADRVRIVGPSDVPALHAASDFAVLPAPANVGTACFPNVLLECMAGGVPLVATRVGCVPEVVQDGRTGLLARPDDAADLARRLTELAGDPVLRRRLAGQARTLAVDRLGWDTVARRMLDVYRQLDVTAPQRLELASVAPGFRSVPLGVR